MNNIIDIRDEHELREKYIESKNQDILILNIPSRNIKFNKEFIVTLSEKNKVYIVCRSGNRSGKVKELYFKDNSNVISVEGGLENLKKIFPDIEIKSGDNSFGMNQHMQTIFLTILLLICILVSFDFNKKFILFVLLSIIFFIYYQISTKSCILGKIIPLE